MPDVPQRWPAAHEVAVQRGRHAFRPRSQHMTASCTHTEAVVQSESFKQSFWGTSTHWEPHTDAGTGSRRQL